MKKQLTKSEIYANAVKIEKQYVSIDTVKKHTDHETFLMINKIRQRCELKSNTITIKEFCDKLIKQRLYEIAKALPDEGYSMGSFVRARISNTFFVTDDRTEEYSRGCKYKANHGSVELKITFSELRNIQVIGGLVTYIYPNQKSKVKKCYWYRGLGCKQNFQLKKENGFIYAGFHAIDKNTAKLGGEANVRREKEKIILEKKFKKATRMQYSFQDSLNAGNCEAGTRAFALRLNLNTERTYRGTFLLKKANEKSSYSIVYIKQMINFKAKTI